MWLCAGSLNTFKVGYPLILCFVQIFTFSSAAQSTAAMFTAGFHSEQETENERGTVNSECGVTVHSVDSVRLQRN